MSCFVMKNCLKFLKMDKLKELINIKNCYLYGFIRWLLFGRFLIENEKSFKMNKEYLKKSNYHLYTETVDIEYLKSKDGKTLIKKISKLKFGTEDGENLMYCINNDKDMEFISFCQFKELKGLYLYSTQITNKTIEHLIKSDFKKIQELYLNNTQITDNAIKYLINCNFKQLKELGFSNTSITDKSIKYLIKCNLKQLESLALSNTQITDKSIKYLIKCNFKQLKELYLSYTQITHKSVDYLIQCDFKYLKELGLTGTKISCTSKLESKYFNCKIYLEQISNTNAI